MTTIRKSWRKAPVCANCETELVGAYCHACGQKAHVHTKLTHLLEEFAEGIVHFDGRLWRTLPLLALQPGQLSREWVAGKRTRYVAPLPLFLFAVFLLFLIPNFTGRHMFDLGQSPAESGEVGTFTIQNADGTTTAIDSNDAEALKRSLKLSGPFAGLVELGVKLRKNPQYYGYKFESLAYKLSFITVPISVLILWSMYAWRRQFSVYQHVVVSLYGLGFIALLFAIAGAFPKTVADSLYLAIGVLAPIHAAIHLHGAYGSGWIWSILRTVCLTVLTFLGFSGFILGVVVLGLIR